MTSLHGWGNTLILTQKRLGAENALEKYFFKLLDNSVFRKTKENIRKRVDVGLVTDQKKLSKLVSKQTYVNSKIFNEDLVVAHKIKEALTLDRPANLRGNVHSGSFKETNV